MRMRGEVVQMNHETLDEFWLACDAISNQPIQEIDSPTKSKINSSEGGSGQWLFTDNETNLDRHRDCQVSQPSIKMHSIATS